MAKATLPNNLDSSAQFALQVKQYCIAVFLNGKTKTEAVQEIFGVEKKPQAYAIVKKIENSVMYNGIKNGVTMGFSEKIKLQAQNAALNYLEKYNSMLDEGEKFIKESDGDMKLRAFANQRTLLESNPFSVLQNLKESDKPADPSKQLSAGDEDNSDISEGVIIQ